MSRFEEGAKLLEKPHEVLITLIIPCYLGQDWIATCLQSIRAQTLSRSKFEVLVIVNGPVDSSPVIVDNIFGGDEDLNYEIIYEDTASLSNARNLGISRARGRWVTWVDVDDWISPNFLQELAEHAEAGVVPLAQLIDVVEGTGEHRTSPITEQILSHPAGIADPATLWRPLGFAACKLMPTDLARESSFDLALRSGEDVAYFAPFMAKHDLKFQTRPAYRGATYYRMLRAGSMSRQEATFDFSVAQRIAVMRHLDRAISSAPDGLAKVMRSLMNSQTLFISRYLDSHPAEYASVREALLGAELQYTPWHYVTSRTPNLAISYNFPPFADASAMVAAKRIHNSGKHWNVVSNNMAGVRGQDASLHEITGPSVSRHHIVNGSTAFGSWRAVEEFCDLGMEAIAEIVEQSGPQANLYSRSMWPASHFLAASHKVRNEDDVRWTAEFSDPLARDVDGKARPSAGGGADLRAELGIAMRERGILAPDSESLFEWAELVAYVLADSLLFTNYHQLNYMLSYIDDTELARTVRRKARIAPQPVLPSSFYSLREPRYELDPSVVNIGYFGTFYENRGAGGVLEALRKLATPVRQGVILHIFAPANKAVYSQVRKLGLSGSISWQEPVPYLEFLSLSTRFDALLVADADTLSTKRRLNPYRPSKLSDYIGAGAPLWALYEPGSILSREDVAYRTRVGDIQGMASVLSSMTKAKFS